MSPFRASSMILWLKVTLNRAHDGRPSDEADGGDLEFHLRPGDVGMH